MDNQCFLILQAFANNGDMTAEEIREESGVPITRIKHFVSHLMKLGYLEDHECFMAVDGWRLTIIGMSFCEIMGIRVK